eukprot:468795_1
MNTISQTCLNGCGAQVSTAGEKQNDNNGVCNNSKYGVHNYRSISVQIARHQYDNPQHLRKYTRDKFSNYFRNNFRNNRICIDNDARDDGINSNQDIRYQSKRTIVANNGTVSMHQSKFNSDPPLCWVKKNPHNANQANDKKYSNKRQRYPISTPNGDENKQETKQNKSDVYEAQEEDNGDYPTVYEPSDDDSSSDSSSTQSTNEWFKNTKQLPNKCKTRGSQTVSDSDSDSDSSSSSSSESSVLDFSEPIEISVITVDICESVMRKTITIHSNGHHNILRIKAKIQLKENILVKQQKLIYNGIELRNDGTVSSYKIKNKSKLYLLFDELQQDKIGQDLRLGKDCVIASSPGSGVESTVIAASLYKLCRQKTPKHIIFIAVDHLHVGIIESKCIWLRNIFPNINLIKQVPGSDYVNKKLLQNRNIFICTPGRSINLIEKGKRELIKNLLSITIFDCDTLLVRPLWLKIRRMFKSIPKH